MDAKCYKCNRVLPLEAFGKVNDRYSSDCRECRHEYQRELKRGRDDWWDWWRGKVAGKWCRGCHRALAESAFAEDKMKPDGLAEFCKSCFPQHDWQTIQIKREQRIKEEARRFRKNHPEKMRAYSRLRQERRANAPGRYTAADVAAQYELQGGLCWWCSEPLNGKYHVDHVLPLSRGGSNWPSNLVCTCAPCNTKKGNRLPGEGVWRPPKPLAGLDEDTNG